MKILSIQTLRLKFCNSLDPTKKDRRSCRSISMSKKKVAVVGSGCSGIAAVWALQSTGHEVHLYEAQNRLGGHTNTVTWKHDGQETQVDTGFIVMNSATYRKSVQFYGESVLLTQIANLISFLKHIGIQTKDTDMTFGISRDQGAFEWAGTSLKSIFAQRENIFSLRMWEMLFDVIRFNEFATDLLVQESESEIDPIRPNRSVSSAPEPRQQSIGEYLDKNCYSDAFKNDYLIPMTASVWSTEPDKAALEFPAITLIRFLWNHHLLNTLAARPTWMTIPGGSHQYIETALKDFPESRIHLSTPVRSIQNRADSIDLCFENGDSEAFDHVVLATHGDTAASIIQSSATKEETDIMSGFQTSKNTAVLHSDLSLMPRKEIAWSAWNYITRSPKLGEPSTVCLTYWMNLLQHIPSSTFGPVLVTLNPLHKPDPGLSQGEWTYHHPLYTAAAVRSQNLLPRIQNKRHISYAGAWTKYGFHEDGFSSGLKVAVEHLGATLPFTFVDSTFSRGRRPSIGFMSWVVRAIIWWIQGCILFVGVALAILGFNDVNRGKTGLKKRK